MELKMQEINFPKVIEFNYEELKASIAEGAARYKNMVYTDETIGDAKKDKAKLNKLINGMETQRKEVKHQCLQPYEDFERKIKELVALVDEPVQLINEQLNVYEEKRKENKIQQIKELWDGTEHPDWLKCNAIWDKRWTNATFKMIDIAKAIDDRLKQIEKDLDTLNSLQEYSFEAIEDYKQSLDLGKAIAEGQRLADIQKRKEEMKKAAEAEKEQAQQISVINTPPIQTVEKPAENAVWLKFEAHLTVTQARALKEFFEGNNIDFRAI